MEGLALQVPGRICPCTLTALLWPGEPLFLGRCSGCAHAVSFQRPGVPHPSRGLQPRHMALPCPSWSTRPQVPTMWWGGWEQGSHTRRDLSLQSGALHTLSSGVALSVFWGKSPTESTVSQGAGSFHRAPIRLWWPSLTLPALLVACSFPSALLFTVESSFCWGPWAAGAGLSHPGLPGKPPTVPGAPVPPSTPARQAGPGQGPEGCGEPASLLQQALLWPPAPRGRTGTGTKTSGSECLVVRRSHLSPFLSPRFWPQDWALVPPGVGARVPREQSGLCPHQSLPRWVEAERGLRGALLRYTCSSHSWSWKRLRTRGPSVGLSHRVTSTHLLTYVVTDNVPSSPR